MGNNCAVAIVDKDIAPGLGLTGKIVGFKNGKPVKWENDKVKKYLASLLVPYSYGREEFASTYNVEKKRPE